MASLRKQLSSKWSSRVIPTETSSRRVDDKSTRRKKLASEVIGDLPLASQDTSRRLLTQESNAAATKYSVGSPSKLPQTAIGRLRERTRVYLDNTFVTAVMTSFTIYALYGDDFRQLAFDASADVVFMVMSSIAFFLFSLEIVLSCWAKPGYLPNPCADMSKEKLQCPGCLNLLMIGSFYFWLDVVATVSLITEIDWILDTSNSQTALESDSGLQSARAGRASRAGARAGRIMRIFRMIRLVRLARLYKYIKKGEPSETEDDVSIPEDEEALSDLPPESHVGRSMADLTTRRVILGVLGMLVLIPLLSYTELDQSSSFGVEMIQVFALDAKQNPAMELGLDNAVNEFLDITDNVVSLDVGGDMVFDDSANYSGLRSTEQLKVYITDVLEDDEVFTTQAIQSIKPQLQEAAGLNMILTTFVIILLAVGTMVFSGDVNRLVLLPIETVVQLVRSISKNPLDYKFKHGKKDAALFKEGFETTLLLQTITKIAGLMRVGFGEAGASVIARNLQESSNNKLNLLTSGKKIESIFGFCDIRQFTDTTECLQEEVMLFVNRIAYIVHSIVVQCKGSANKNIGDAFLLTWKLDGFTPVEVTTLTDKALYSFLKIIAELGRTQEYMCRFSVAAMSRLFDRMPAYKVRIGFGLHLGWAIEGAIGSDKKIDASYISPHVTMAEFLESSTKSYGVQLLMSEAFFSKLSPEAQKHCRQVDCIQRSAKELPMGLYTHDCDVNQDFKAPYTTSTAHQIPSSSRPMQGHYLPSLTEQSITSRRATHRRSSGAIVNSSTRSSASTLSNSRSTMRDAAEAARRAVEEEDGKEVSHIGTGATVTAVQQTDASRDLEEGRSAAASKWSNNRMRGNTTRRSIVQGGLGPLPAPGRRTSTDGHAELELRTAIERRRSALLMRQGSSSVARNQWMLADGPLTRQGTLKRGDGVVSKRASVCADQASGQKAVHPALMLRQSSMGVRKGSVAGRNSIILNADARGGAGDTGDDAMETPIFNIPSYSRQLWMTDDDLVRLRRHISQDFMEEWRDALDNYLSGNWREALQDFRELNISMDGSDGPTKAILDHLETANGVTPPEWKGYRKLW